MSDDRVAVARLLHRLGFGPAGTQFERALELGPAAVAGELMLAVSPASAAADAAVTPPPPLPYLTLAGAGSRAAYEQARRDQERVLRLWWLDRMATTEQPLLERTTWFWHGHWATSELKVRDSRLMLRQNETLRATALGDFKEQARLMLMDPALLIWLDGKGNRKGQPNENLGREFLELFSLGDGNYTETDVREASRALTGWTIDMAAGTSALQPNRFDNGFKEILGTRAAYDAATLAYHVASQPACARHIAGRWWRHCVSADAASPAHLQPLIDAFAPERNSGRLALAVAAVLQDTSIALPLAKSPVDWLVGAMRVLDMRPTSLSRTLQNGLLTDLSAMGQHPFFPPNVSGWPTGRAWFTTTAAQARLKSTQRLVTKAPRWLATARRGSRSRVLADRLGIPAWSPPTAAALADGAISAKDALIIALNSPDYLVGV